MLSWSTILGGGVMSAIAAGLLVAVVRPRRGLVIAVASVAAFLGPVSWNAILHRVEGRQFFVDAPVAAFPISWQDTGSGVFTVALGDVLLGLGAMAHDDGRRLALTALLTGVAALVVDVYLY